MTQFRTAALWKAYLSGAGAEEIKVQIDILDEIETLANTLAPPLNNTPIAPVANVVSLGNMFVGQAIIAIIGIDVNGNPVPISTLLANPAYTNGTPMELIQIQGAINNANLSNNVALSGTPNQTSTNIDINLIAGHGLVNVIFITTPSNI